MNAHNAPAIIALPSKPTCTPAEAAKALGVSDRQVRYWIEDGTLLAISVSRLHTVRKKISPKNERETSVLKQLDCWRVVVRRHGDDTPRDMAFLTLEEFVNRTSNKQKE